MDIPNHFPTQSPWSPVGYDVVEVDQEQTLAGWRRQQDNAQPRRPSAGVGYHVAVVGEEKSESQREGRRRPSRRTTRNMKREKTVTNLTIIVATGALLTLAAIGVGAAIFNASDSRPSPRVNNVALVDEAPPQQIPAPPQLPKVIIPKVVDGKVQAKPQAAENIAPINAAGMPKMQGTNGLTGICQLPNNDMFGDKDFGTAIRFARNPTEAFHSAKKDRKLALILHVSGNFEEARFT